MIATVVHTTGVNWDGVLANAAAVSIILVGLGAVVVKSIRRSIGEQITQIIEEKITPLLREIEQDLRQHDTRIARLEGVEEGRRQAVAAAGVSTTRSISSRKADP